MTHSLHRQGNRESLKNDFVFLSQPAMGINSDGAAEKMARITDIVFKVGPANIGSYEAGSIFTGITADDIKENLKDNSRIRCNFDSKEKVESILNILKEEELGISIVISGLIDEVENICKNVGLTPHSINLSLGIFGKVEKLPDEEILELTTMCGHGMIGADLVRKVIIDLKNNRIDFEEAGEILSKPCVCGIFNPTRAKKLLKENLNLWKVEE